MRTIFLIATISVLLISSPAAHAAKNTLPPGWIDVAAQPAYPFKAEKRSGINRAASSRRAKPHREASKGEDAPNASPRAPQVEIGSGVVRSAKTGATARVAAKWRASFQAYIDDLEAAGASIYYMGGYRAGTCSTARQHPCGAALDVCQDSRGHVSGARDCHLPDPTEVAKIAARHGLFEGGLWCNSDFGHAQAMKSAEGCPSRSAASGWQGDGKRHYLASITGTIQFAANEHHRRGNHRRIRLARR